MKKSSLLIGTLLILFYLAFLLWAELIKHEPSNLAGWLLSVYAFISIILSVIVAWEARDFVWFAFAIIIYLFAFFMSIGLILATIIPIIFLIVRFGSWKLVIQRIRR